MFVMRTSGGGGVGARRSSAPSTPCWPTSMDGRVTPEGAARDYGVVFDADRLARRARPPGRPRQRAPGGGGRASERGTDDDTAGSWASTSAARSPTSCSATPKGEVVTCKVRDHARRSRGAVTAGIEELLGRTGVDPGRVARVVHGTTLATNVILERRGSPVAFVTTEGFADMVRLGREARVEDERFDLCFTTPEPPVEPRRHVRGPERVSSNGAVTSPLTRERGRGDRRGAPRDRHRGRHLLPQLLRRTRCTSVPSPRRSAPRSRTPTSWHVVGGLAGAARVRACDDHGHVRLRRPGDGRYLSGLEARCGSSASPGRSRSWTPSGGVMSAAMAARGPCCTLESGGAAGRHRRRARRAAHRRRRR